MLLKDAFEFKQMFSLFLRVDSHYGGMTDECCFLCFRNHNGLSSRQPSSHFGAADTYGLQATGGFIDFFFSTKEK